MHSTEYKFSQKTVSCYFNADFSAIDKFTGDAFIVIITDENVYSLHAEKFRDFPVIKIQAGEEHKNQATVDHIIAELINLGAHKNTFILGVGGGVVTDIAGYPADTPRVRPGNRLE